MRAVSAAHSAALSVCDAARRRLVARLAVSATQVFSQLLTAEDARKGLSIINLRTEFGKVNTYYNS